MSRIGRNSALQIVVPLTLCAGLFLMPIGSLLQGTAAQTQTASRTAPPRSNRPEGILPNLDEIKNESHLRREGPAPIPSTMRSQKNEGKPWDGRRVGQPFTENQWDQLALNRNHKRMRRSHARARMNPPPLYEDQFIQNFFSLALGRNTTYEETLYWNYLLRAGYGQSFTSLKLAAIELGKTLFESAAYAARNRDSHWYVYDLYKTYLMREPDAAGWATWEGLVSSHGREYVRRGFEESGEFATVVANILPSGGAGPNPSSLISARTEPRNQPGNGMLARDANWSMPLSAYPDVMGWISASRSPTLRWFGRIPGHTSISTKTMAFRVPVSGSAFLPCSAKRLTHKPRRMLISCSRRPASVWSCVR